MSMNIAFKQLKTLAVFTGLLLVSCENSDISLNYFELSATNSDTRYKIQMTEKYCAGSTDTITLMITLNEGDFAPCIECDSVTIYLSPEHSDDNGFIADTSIPFPSQSVTAEISKNGEIVPISGEIRFSILEIPTGHFEGKLAFEIARDRIQGIFKNTVYDNRFEGCTPTDPDQPPDAEQITVFITQYDYYMTWTIYSPPNTFSPNAVVKILDHRHERVLIEDIATSSGSIQIFSTELYGNCATIETCHLAVQQNNSEVVDIRYIALVHR